MKKDYRIRILCGMAAVLMLSSFTACTDSSGESRGLYTGSSDPQPTEGTKPGGDYADIPVDELFLLFRNTNGAWFRENNGYAVYTNGAVYGFSFDSETWDTYDGEDVSFDDALEYIRQNTKPSFNIGMDFVKEAYSYGIKIDPNAGFKTEQAACDAGQSTLYFVNDGDEIEVYSSGDMEETPKDKNAKKLKELWRDTQWPKGMQQQVGFYDGYDTSLVNVHCGYKDGIDGRYYLENEEELRKFAAFTGINVAQVVENMSEYTREYNSYFVQIDNVSSGGYDLKACAIMNNDGAISFVMSKDSVSPAPGDVTTAVMDGFCYAAAYPRVFDKAAIAASGWTTYEDAVMMNGWDESSIIKGTMYTNPELCMSDDGGAMVFAYDYDGDIPVATVYAPDGFYLDTEISDPECVVFRLQDDPDLCFKVYPDMPGLDSDYYYYDTTPGPDFEFTDPASLSREIDGHELMIMTRINPYLEEEQEMIYVFFTYGPDATPYTLSVAIPREVWDAALTDHEDMIFPFVDQLFNLR